MKVSESSFHFPEVNTRLLESTYYCYSHWHFASNPGSGGILWDSMELSHSQQIHISIPLCVFVSQIVAIPLFCMGSCRQHTDGSVQDCSNSLANALELLHPCTKPSIYIMHNRISDVISQKRYIHSIITSGTHIYICDQLIVNVWDQHTREENSVSLKDLGMDWLSNWRVLGRTLSARVQ